MLRSASPGALPATLETPASEPPSVAAAPRVQFLMKFRRFMMDAPVVWNQGFGPGDSLVWNLHQPQFFFALWTDRIVNATLYDDPSSSTKDCQEPFGIKG